MVKVFIWLIIFLVVLQLLLLGLLIASKKRSLLRDKSNIQALNLQRSTVHGYVSGKNPSFPELPKKQATPAILELLLDEYSDQTLSREERARVSALADHYLAAHYRKILKKGAWAERLNALYFIEDFRIYTLRDDCYRHYRKLTKRDEEYRQALRTCATLQEERLLAEQLEENDISSGLVKELLFRLNDDLLAKAVSNIQQKEDLPETALLAFIMFCGEQKIDIAFPYVEQKLDDERKEVRLKAMHSLSLYGKVSNSELIRPFFDSEVWEERMYAAKLAGACKLDEFKDCLLKTMADANWWVRYSSAEGLKSCTDGELLLQEAAAVHEDAYARDIARHVLTRKGRSAS